MQLLQGQRAHLPLSPLPIYHRGHQLLPLRANYLGKKGPPPTQFQPAEPCSSPQRALTSQVSVSSPCCHFHIPPSSKPGSWLEGPAMGNWLWESTDPRHYRNTTGQEKPQAQTLAQGHLSSPRIQVSPSPTSPQSRTGWLTALGGSSTGAHPCQDTCARSLPSVAVLESSQVPGAAHLRQQAAEPQSRSEASHPAGPLRPHCICGASPGDSASAHLSQPPRSPLFFFELVHSPRRAPTRPPPLAKEQSSRISH